MNSQLALSAGASFRASSEASGQSRAPLSPLRVSIVGTGQLGGNVGEAIQKLRITPNQSRYDFTFPNADAAVPTALFEALAKAKVLTSRVAMHLERKWRDSFFSKLDRMHNPDYWDPDDTPLVTGSVNTFLRALFTWKPTENPSIGLSTRGNLLAAWRDGERRLTIEFYPDDVVGFVVARPFDDITSTHGKTPINGLARVLSPYPQVGWFKFGKA